MHIFYEKNAVTFDYLLLPFKGEFMYFFMWKQETYNYERCPHRRYFSALYVQVIIPSQNVIWVIKTKQC